MLKDLAPTGKLRAAINLGNGVLAQTDAATGKPKGITPDLAMELGRRLGVPVELVVYQAAGKVFDANGRLVDDAIRQRLRNYMTGFAAFISGGAGTIS